MALSNLPFDVFEQNKTDFTKVSHKEAYPTISATRPELSQAGKTVLITGGATNIGKNIATQFLRAGASTIVITGRRKEVLDAGVEYLKAEAQRARTSTTTIARVSDQSDRAAVKDLWLGLQQDGIFVDTMVLNAADFTDQKPILELGADRLWAAFETNVRGPLDMIEGLWKQPGDKPKAIVNVSTQAINMFYDVQLIFPSMVPGYGLTKNAGTLLLQQIAKDVSPDKLQIVSFHPGMIYTDTFEKLGVTEKDLPFIDPNLPGSFALWAASKEASFLHGRFVWAEWDIDEYSKGELRKQIDENVDFIRIGVVGLRGARIA